MDLVLKKKFIDKIFLIILIIVSVALYWIIYDISGRIHPEEGERLSNLYKYNLYYYSYDLEFVLNEKLFNDFGYYVFVLSLKELGIKFEFFIFFLFCSYFYIIIKTYEKLYKSRFSIILTIPIILLSIVWADAIIGATVRQGCAFILLIYALILNDKKNPKINYLLFIIAISFHFSAIIFLPIFIFTKFLEKRIGLLDKIIFIIIIFYIFQFPTQLSNYVNEFFLKTGINSRSLLDTDHPTAGFSIYKLMALILPLIFLRATNFSQTICNSIKVKIYLFYTIPTIIGIFFSGLAYHDRIFLYAWSISPPLYALALHSFFIKIYENEKLYKE